MLVKNQGLFNMSKVIDRVFIRKEDREIYKRVRSEEGDLKGVDNIDIFIISMMLAYDKYKKEGVDVMKKDQPILNDGIIRTASFSSDVWLIIKSFAVHIAQDPNILADTNKILDIAQRYAFEGISILDELYNDNKHNFINTLENLISQKFDEDNIGF